MRWRVHLESLIRFGGYGYRMYVGREHPDGSMDVMVPPVTLQSMKPGEFMGPEKALIDDSATTYDSNVRSLLQAMSDAAWDIGIRPKQIEDHASELKATKYHLEDMRTLALKGGADARP